MHTVTSHCVPGSNMNLTVTAKGEPGPGGAFNRYEIEGFNTVSNAVGEPWRDDTKLTILFQNGDPVTKGVNGVTLETLMAVCIDRLEGFQAGPFSCCHNQEALIALEKAMLALRCRTKSELTKTGITTVAK